MRCYKHPKEEAVGMCKVCNKGLCEQCAVDKDDFVFCRHHADMPDVVERVEEEALATVPKAQVVRAAPRMAPVPAPRPRPHVPKTFLRVTPNATVAPAILGGIVSGVLMGFPFVNIPCIIWLVLGGMVAAYFLVLDRSSRDKVNGCISIRVGALVGGLSGLLGASIAMVISLFVAVNFSDLIAGGIANLMDPGTAALAAQALTTDPNLDVVSLLVKYVAMLIIFPLFGMIGGALAAKLSR